MKSDRYDRQDLARLVRQHGGVLGAMEFGVFARDIEDPELANAWRQIEDSYSAMRPALQVVSQLILKPKAAAESSP